jgi:predicted membrane protein DUF2127
MAPLRSSRTSTATCGISFSLERDSLGGMRRSVETERKQRMVHLFFVIGVIAKGIDGVHSAQGLSAGAKMFGAIYLLWHGVVKVGLVAALLLKRRWAYPVAIVAFLLFLAYQLYRYSHTYAPELLVLSVLDVVVIVLTWFEYGRLRGSHAFAS